MNEGSRTTTGPAMDLDDLEESGLLWYANQVVFWPRGLALTIARHKETGQQALFVQMRPGPVVDTVNDTTIQRLKALVERDLEWYEAAITNTPPNVIATPKRRHHGYDYSADQTEEQAPLPDDR